jgi:hypothetical protein
LNAAADAAAAAGGDEEGDATGAAYVSVREEAMMPVPF